MLELAVLGLLHEAPMHGYELRKRLHDTLGAFRAFSCGTLYPTLRRMSRAGLIEEKPESVGERGWSRRARRVYRLTAEGKERFAALAEDCGPHACEDDSFGVHVAFFSRTPAEARLRILEGRRRRVEERREGLRTLLAGPQHRLDRYTRELHRLGLGHSEHEVRWLTELIEHERTEQAEPSARAARTDGKDTDDR
jgi:DNA-binding PadR family transcriptional regulator